MIFLSPWFILFVILLIPLYWLIPRGLQFILIFSSLFFYEHFAGGISAIIPILTLGTISYLCGLAPRKFQYIGILLCILALIFYKYTIFISDNTPDSFEHPTKARNLDLA